MANYIESSEVARPYRASKRRGPQPDRLSVKLFLLDPESDVTRINKDTWSQKERARLRSIGYGPPQSDLVNKDNKIQFPFSMTTEEFKNRLVEIYPKLQDKRFLLLRADKSNVLQGLNIAPCYYNPEDIYHSNLGQGTLYIKCLGEDIQTTLPGLSPSKRARTTITELNSSAGLRVYRIIRPKPASETAASGSSFSMVASSAASTLTNSAVRCLPAVSSSTSTATVCSNSSSATTGIVATQRSIPTQIIANQGRGVGLAITRTGLENFSSDVEGEHQQEHERQRPQRQQQLLGPQRLDVIRQQQLQQQGQVPERLNQQQQLQQFFQQPVQSERQQQLPQMLHEQQEQQEQLVQVPQDLGLQQLLQQLQQPHQSERQQQLQQPPPEQQSRVQEPQVSRISSQHQQLQQGFQPDVLFQQQLLQLLQQQQQQQQQQGEQPQQQLQQQHVAMQQSSPENFQQRFTQLMPNSVNSLLVSRNMVASQSQTAAVSSSLPVFRPQNMSVTQSLSYQRIQDASLTNNGVTKISPAFPLTFQKSVNVPPVQQTLHNNQASTFASSESLLSSTSPVYIPSSLQNYTDSASPLNTLADATVERGPINPDESFDIQNSDVSGTTVDLQEDLPISRCDEFNLDDFIKDIQRTGRLKVSEKVFKSDDLVTRLESTNLNIQSMGIHEYCKLDKSLKRFPLPSSLKVLIVQKNRLDDSDVSSVCNAFFKLSGLEELDLSCTKFVGNSCFMFLSGFANLKGVKRLSLCDCGITTQETLVLVAVLESLKDLEVLNLSSNYLSDENANILIGVLSKLKRFKVLDLSNNILTGNKAIVSGLSMLKTVEKLDFSSNYLSVEGVDNETKKEKHFPCNVTEISVSSNRMVPDDFGNFCQYLSSSVLLEKLEIDSNYLGHSIWSLHSLAWKFPNLKVLNLSNTQLWVATDGLKCLLSNLGQLEELYLASNKFLLKDFQKLGPVLSTLMHLRVLDMSDNPVDFSISAVLQHVLSRIVNLEVLKMRSNHFDAGRLKAICPSIASLTCLKSLDLSNNWLGSEGAGQLSEVLPFLRKLENLDLRKTRMCGDGINKLCAAVASMKNMKSLCLGDNKLCSEAVSALANSLSSLSLIEELNLSATGLNGLGVAAIFHSCGVFENLKRISLRKNKLDLPGSSALGKALFSMPSLEELDLEKCYLDDECLKCICHSISCLNGLRKLNLSYSTINPAGCDALAIKLPSLQSLRELRLGTFFSTEISQMFIPAIISLKCLKILDLKLENCKTDSNLEANLACVLPSLQLLEELVLTGDGCDNLLKQFISLGCLNFLKRFELTGRLTGCSATALGKMLSTLKFLEKLVLDYEYYYEEWDCDSDCYREKLTRSIESLKHLKTLRIPALWGACAAFASALKSLSSLESLTFIPRDDDLMYDCCCGEVFIMSIGSLKYLRELGFPGMDLCFYSTAALTTVLPSLLFLEKLTIADCYDCCCDDDLAKLFDSFKSLTHLRTLHINYNNLCSSGVRALADMLPSLQLLEELKLRLVCFSYSAEKLILSIKSVAFLKKLALRLGRICFAEAAALARVLPSSHLLESLTIEVSNFDNYEKVFLSLKPLRFLKKLNLKLKTSGSDVETLASVLPSLQFLEKLKITYECDGSDHEKVLHSLKSLNCLKILHVSGIKTTSTGAAALPGVLQSIQPLEELKMSLTVHDNDNNFTLFLSSISKKFKLSGEKVGPSGVSAVNSVLASLSLLEKLAIDVRSCDDDGILFLSFESLTCLKKLSLKNFSVSSAGILTLARVLPSQPLLEKLEVSVTCSDDDEKLFPSFKSLKCLKELTLWKNGLSSDGISALASVLPLLPLLEYLNLGDTKITSAAVEPLVQVLPSLPSLKDVNLCGKDLTEADRHKIKSAASPGVCVCIF